MNHRITFIFKPVTVEVETFSGLDVAEEIARSKLRAQIAEGSIPIWCADWSKPNVLRCPKCNAPEEHPSQTGKVLIRAFKVDGKSQCLVCAGFYDFYDSQWKETPSNYDNLKGWFSS